VNLGHTLRREATGAWRSARYDLERHRAARVAGAFTEEFGPSPYRGAGRSRVVPLVGVTLLLVGGAAGAALAIGGGLAALGIDEAAPFGGRPRTASQAPLSESRRDVGTARPLTSRRTGVHTTPVPGAAPAPAGAPVPEASTLPANPDPDPHSPDPGDPDPGGSHPGGPDPGSPDPTGGGTDPTPSYPPSASADESHTRASGRQR
jgi:hypothetical protein